MRKCIYVLVASFCVAVALHAQDVDPQLMSYIDSVKAVDNHAHVLAPDIADDKGYDALRCDELPSSPSLVPANLRFGASTQETWKALYGVEPKTAEEAEQKHPAMLQKLQDEHGDNYYNWILDQAGIETVLANRVTMTPSLQPPRFLWVPYVDALLFPFDTSTLETNPDRKLLFAMERDVRQMYLRQSGVSGNPATLDQYVDKVVLPTLQRLKDDDAVAIKFEAAYLRSLDFAPATHGAAAEIYRRAAGGAGLQPTEYKLLQDYLFYVIVAQAGKSGLPVHIHTGTGCGRFFDTNGANPMLLEKVFNDSTLRETKFVLLHGGSPFERSNLALIIKPNVYVDTSELELMFSPSAMARTLRPWMEVMPEHVIFGTDADFFSSGMQWQETTWLGSRNARRALGIVLTEMMKDGAISMARAKEIAERVLRRNAVELYQLAAKN